MPRIAALDFGKKRIGLAISDANGHMALPQPLILAGKTDDETIDRILAVLQKYAGEITTIVVGLPKHMNGTMGEMAQMVQQFIGLLEKKTTIPVRTIDERLSSAQANRFLSGLSYSRKKRSSLVDSTAAAILLQTYLDQPV